MLQALVELSKTIRVKSERFFSVDIPFNIYIMKPYKENVSPSDSQEALTKREVSLVLDKQVPKYVLTKQ
ncbi:hypothetical protein TUM4249_33410 [Shewanella sp. KT0246]|nr:hypothetical protein TUM4249_33410 [Shewanella sp. KT0246]